MARLSAHLRGWPDHDGLVVMIGAKRHELKNLSSPLPTYLLETKRNKLGLVTPPNSLQ